MKQYLDLLKRIKECGRDKGDRTGTGTRSVFAPQLRFNLREGFPLLTTKKVFFRGVIEEMLWYLSGSTNNNDLVAKNIHIWDGWALENGDLGPIYGKQWTSWESYKVVDDDNDDVNDNLIKDGYSFVGDFFSTEDGKARVLYKKNINQIKEASDLLRDRPDSRRIIVSAWNTADMPDERISPHENVRRGKACLSSCQTMFQFYTHRMELVERVAYAINEMGIDDTFSDMNEIEIEIYLNALNVPSRVLNCQLYQRSGDVFLGVPFNIACYAALTHMFAHVHKMAVGEFVWTGGDIHIYSNHWDAVNEQLTREPRPLPQLKFKREVNSVFDFKYDDFELVGYDPHPPIKAQISI